MCTEKQKSALLFLRRRKKEWERKSLKYYKRFQKDRSPGVIIEFVKSSSFALLEGWVMRVIMQWRIEGKHGLLQKVFLPQQGERAENNMYIMRNAIISHSIDALVAQGMNKTAAIECYCAQDNPIVRYWNVHVDQIRRIYYATKKKRPDVYVYEDSNSFVMYVYPAKCVIGENCILFGLLQQRFLKKDLAPPFGELFRGGT